MTKSIKAKHNKLDGQTNIYKYGVTAQKLNKQNIIMNFEQRFANSIMFLFYCFMNHHSSWNSLDKSNMHCYNGLTLNIEKALLLDVKMMLIYLNTTKAVFTRLVFNFAQTLYIKLVVALKIHIQWCQSKGRGIGNGDVYPISC